MSMQMETSAVVPNAIFAWKPPSNQEPLAFHRPSVSIQLANFLDKRG